jgi:hypothetical protein
MPAFEILKSVSLVLFAGFSALFMNSCARTYKLSEHDYNWMPYSGNETLVFKSNTGRLDTIFLLKKDTGYGYADQYSANSSRYSILSVFCRHTDEVIEGKKYYSENHLLQIIKREDNDAEFNVRVYADNAWLYRRSRISIDSLEKEKPIRVVTNNRSYDDVYVINGEDHSGYGERSNFITKAYWSKSNGLIRYDKKDSVYWELEKKW